MSESKNKARTEVEQETSIETVVKEADKMTEKEQNKTEEAAKNTEEKAIGEMDVNELIVSLKKTHRKLNSMDKKRKALDDMEIASHSRLKEIGQAIADYQ